MSDSTATRAAFPNGRDVSFGIITIAVVVVLLGAYAKSFGDAANSRMATVLSLTEHGTFFIDPVDGVANPFEQGTIDKVVVDGRILSSKPPMLPLFMTAQYIVMNRAFGYDVHDETDRDEVIRWMSIILIGGSYVLCLVFFHRTTGMFIQNEGVRAFALFALAFGTQLWGYSGNINNHMPGAGMLTVSMYYALGLLWGKVRPGPWPFLIFGLTGGLTFAFDMPAAVFVAFAGLALIYKFPAQAILWGGIGMAGPVITHCAIMIVTTGSPMPVQTHREYYESELSYWRHPIAVDALNEKKGNYLFHMLVGRSGLFSLYPILLSGVAGFLVALIRRKDGVDKAIIGAFGAFIILSLYYLLKTDNYGGQSYGFRWYIVAMPILMLMGVRVLERMRRSWHRVFIALMVAISFYSAWECTNNAWRANHEWTTRFLGKTYIW